MSALRSLPLLCHYLEPPENGSYSFLEVIPALVPLVHHLLELAGRVGAVLAGQAPVLLIDQLQLRQALVDLPLERLQGKARSSFPGNSQEVDITHQERWCPPPLKTVLPTAKLNPDFKTRILNHLLKLSSLEKERKE